ncbi:MAG: hypothetical protein QME32_00360 [Endomicrobiia bacterium]|nr:hypothetical protein [Endomicrobiia bacterium]
MKYSLDFNIIATDIILNALKNEVPLKTDSRLWQAVEGYELVKTLTEDLSPVLRGFVRFNTQLDAEAIRDKVQAKVTPAVLSQIQAGSYLRLHTCDHDSPDRTGCKIVWEWKK